MKTLFAFDLDGTITREELLPRIASHVADCGDMVELTRMAVSGEQPFAESFLKRVAMLENVPLQEIRRIVSKAPLDEDILAFIHERPGNCLVLSSNLDIWVKPLEDKIGCRIFTSYTDLSGNIFVLDKAYVIQQLQEKDFKVIAVGDGANDLEMLRAADESVAFGGVNHPCADILTAAKHYAGSGRELCALLRSFCKN